MILTRKQLEDIRTCSSHRCSECSFVDDCDCGAKAVVAETAPAYRAMLERLEFAGKSDMWGWKYCPICGVGVDDRNHASDCELAALLKESEGEQDG